MNRLVLILLLTLPALVWAQPKDIPVNISLFNEATAIPYTRLLTTPIHPGIQLGTEFNYRNGQHSRLFQTANISYFYHNYLAQGIAINSEIAYEYRMTCGAAFTALLGVGYMHTFATTEEFTFSNGHYEKKADKGNARLYPSFSMDVGYYINKSSETSSKVFIRYQSWLEYPYSPGFIPVMSHINVHAGMKFFILRKEK
jgi:hypothetical protein